MQPNIGFLSNFSAIWEQTAVPSECGERPIGSSAGRQSPSNGGDWPCFFRKVDRNVTDRIGINCFSIRTPTATFAPANHSYRLFQATMRRAILILPFLFFVVSAAFAQRQPYDVFPDAKPPYYRVRYEPSDQSGELRFGVNYTIWIPDGVKTLKGVIVHQHGCGEGSCKSGLTGAFDLHWQALAARHHCALMAPAYEQPAEADCQLWCDPRNGSSDSFQRALVDLGKQSQHPELGTVPWALWGHSGGGHWAGGMVLMHPDRVAAAWLRSGVPLVESNPDRPTIKTHVVPEGALSVPMMCNLGTKEGVTVTDGRFSKVWPANEVFFDRVRGAGGQIGIAIDPLTSHECGNQRYLAIPWLDACLQARLPEKNGQPLRKMSDDDAWLAKKLTTQAVSAKSFSGDPREAIWIPNESVTRAWMQYVKDTRVLDGTAPPPPTDVTVTGNVVAWEANADLESGLEKFLIYRDGELLGSVPEDGKNRFGRPIFQNLQYSDTPTQPLVPMRYTDISAKPDASHRYSVVAVNTAGLQSPPTDAVAARRPNVLFIAIDDLNDWIGCFGGHPQVITPHIDALATRGVKFTNAHCQAPICNPSRVSMLLGQLPSTSGMYFLGPRFRSVEPTRSGETLFQTLRKNGYYAATMGKIFHGAADPDSFDHVQRNAGWRRGNEKLHYTVRGSHPLWDWGQVDVPDEEQRDYKTAQWAAQEIPKLASKDSPFVLAVGFHLPHVPIYASKKWFDLYPLEQVQLPDVTLGDRSDLPEIAKILTDNPTAPRHQWMVDNDEWRHAVRAYLAANSFVDSLVGMLTDALDKSGAADNTIVVLWSDHGFHLGEKLRWAKRTLWEETTRVPMVIAGPGVATDVACGRPVGLIDVYPTLLDLCGVPPRDVLEGQSLRPLLKDPRATWERPAICTFGPNNHSLRSKHFRYTIYSDGSQELYDHRSDPNEWQNLIAADGSCSATHGKVVEQMKKWLPKKNVDPVPGSAGSDSPLYGEGGKMSLGEAMKKSK